MRAEKDGLPRVTRVTVLQPVVPVYRLGFFDRLAERIGGGFKVFASDLDAGVITDRQSSRAWETKLGPIVPVFFGVDWQVGALRIPVNRGDVVVIWGSARCLSNILLLLKAKFAGAHAVWWGHYRSSTSRGLRTALRFLVMKVSTHIMFYTDREVRDYLEENSHINSGRVFALNNGIETREIKNLRLAYDARNRKRRLLFIGRLTSKTDLGHLLQALAEPCCADVSLDIIGAGPLEVCLREEAVKLKIGDRVFWHGATVDETKIALIANQCVAFVYPGAVGLSLIHALNYGLPAIVNDDRRANNPEIAAMTDGLNGFAFQSGSVKSLSATISIALSDIERLNVMSKAAIETTERSFHIEDMVDRFCLALETITR